jgi:phosphoserine phosphatase RsbU/P
MNQDGEVEYVNCGSVPPLLVTAESSEYLEEGSFALGLVPEAEYRSVTLKLKANDKFLLFSDGVTEAMDATGEEMFGTARLREVCREDLTGIVETIDKFSRGILADDFTLVELTYLGRPE